MANAEKVAISLDSELLEQAERLRERTGESRSALVARALRHLMRADMAARKREEYVQVRISPIMIGCFAPS
jgi:metal-responsive CopG/Arc/MetJ family transcriptional regulator